MAKDQLTFPLTDEDLLRLAFYRYARADKGRGDDRRLRPVRGHFSVVLRRLEEKLKVTFGVVRVAEIDLNDPLALRRLTAAAAE